MKYFVKTSKKKEKGSGYLRNLGVAGLGAVIGGVLLKRYGAKSALAVNMPKMEIPRSKWAKYWQKMRSKWADKKALAAIEKKSNLGTKRFFPRV